MGRFFITERGHIKQEVFFPPITESLHRRKRAIEKKEGREASLYFKVTLWPYDIEYRERVYGGMAYWGFQSKTQPSGALSKECRVLSRVNA